MDRTLSTAGTSMPTPGPAPEPFEEAVARERLQEAVGNAFEVRGRIGQGGFADVFEAFDPQLKRAVALKVLRADVAVTPELLARFRREAESIAAVRHPNILPIHAIGERDSVIYLVLDRVDGESLDKYLERIGRVQIDEAVRMLREAAGALGAAHRAGIIHRDLKPANVMLEGPERRVLLM